ncbi:MAG: hypothetical protein HWN80_03140 [Candidatus Lokiarchaeota archaeon]|nr:hypothetical protein [Candidatus Lokiarchaeota archaeon]
MLYNKQKEISLEDIKALKSIFELFLIFINKFPIKKPKFNFVRFKRKLDDIEHRFLQNKEITDKEFVNLLDKLKSTIQKVVIPELVYIIGWHGGIIINDIGFCEFDDPSYSLDRILKSMRLALDNQMPYNLEVAVSCLKWLNEREPRNFEEFLNLFKQGKCEIINPSYSQPYSLIIGQESNLKHFEYGLKNLKKVGLDSNMYYCSENSIHPQIPQILKGFNIKYASLRTRLAGVNPTAISPHINWVGLDNTSVDAIVDQSGIFNGEYWHGTFFQELPSLLFQAVARPFMKKIVYSNLEDFINNMPYQEEIWRLSKFSNVFGKFLSFSEFFELTEKDGDFKYIRDEFHLNDYVFQLSKLFLYNKNSEIFISTCEILNAILSCFSKESKDTLFENLWEKLLPIQAHDCYVVPYIRSGDYSQTQLNIEELRNIKLTKNPNSISELSNQIHKDIQEICNNQMNVAISEIATEILKDQIDMDKKPNTIFVFNPTPYSRRDIVSVPIDQKNNHRKFIAEVPGYGYKIYSISEDNNQIPKSKSHFLYDIKISSELKKIEVKYKNKLIYELSFLPIISYELELINNYKTDVEEKYIFRGNANNQSFTVEIVQFSGNNRLEIILDINSKNHVILTPKVNLQKSLINYPFGIEETRRRQIQTLDFMWLNGINEQIIYIQKNSQRFEINQDNFELKNILFDKGRYEFAIVITDKKDALSILEFVNSYYVRLLGIGINQQRAIYHDEKSFLSVKPPLPIVSLWRRKSGLYLRTFNPTNEDIEIKFDGILVGNQLKEVDFLSNEIASFNTNKTKIGPWKIKTFKLQ